VTEDLAYLLGDIILFPEYFPDGEKSLVLEYCVNGDILLAENSLVGENILNEGCSLAGDIALS
jgi:hypothetical protein